MQSFQFEYARMTFPEVAELHREIPLVLPFGSRFDIAELFLQLGKLDQFVYLPPLPFGWQNSELPVPAPVFKAMVENLIQCLYEDGFSHVSIFAPRGSIDWDSCPVLFYENNPARLYLNREDRQKVVILPVGHTEQHGYHLPLSTDTLIIDRIAEETRQMEPDACFNLPVFPYGVSTHRKSFAGTLNCGGRAFEDFWLAVIDELARQGFQRFYLISGHGGNCSFLNNVVKYAGERHPNIFCATAWLYLSGPDGIAALEQMRESPVGGMGHACELETSLMRYLAPGLVHMERVVDEADFITTRSYYMDWIEGGALVANPPWEDDSRTGALGIGSLGTAEKGKFWLEAAAREKAGHVREIIEQHTRRCEKRARLSQ